MSIEILTNTIRSYLESGGNPDATINVYSLNQFINGINTLELVDGELTFISTTSIATPMELAENWFDVSKETMPINIPLYIIDHNEKMFEVNTPQTSPVNIPLVIALAKCGYSNAVRLLIEYGAIIEKNILAHVCEFDPFTKKKYDVDTIRLLIEAGADVNAVNLIPTNDNSQLNSRTHFKKIVLAQNIPIIKLLIEYGVELHDELLFDAINTYNPELVQLLLDAGLNVNAVENRVTPLMTVIRNSNIDAYSLDKYLQIFHLLIDAGADINYSINECNKHITAVFFACFYGNWTIFKMLIDLGANIEIDIMLIVAAGGGSVEIVRFLLDSGASVKSNDNRSPSPLFYAKNLDIFKLFLDHGADINYVDATKKRSILMQMVHENSYENVKFLLESGVDPNQVNSDGKPALAFVNPSSCTIKNSHIKIIEMLLQYGADPNLCPDIVAQIINTKKNTCHILELILDAGFDPNYMYDDANSLIHLSVSANSPDHVKILLKYGTDINVKNSRGQMPIHLMTSPQHMKSLELLELLLEHGANINQKDANGNTLLHLVVMDTHYNNCIQLKKIMTGENQNETNDSVKNHFEIFYACKELQENKKYLEYVQFLLNAGSDISIQNNQGLSVLDIVNRYSKKIDK